MRLGCTDPIDRSLWRRGAGVLAARVRGLVAAALVLASATSAPARDLVLYAEPTLKPVMRSIGAMWRAQSGVRVNVFVARTELSFQQIEHGARCDVIVAVAGDTMDDASNDKLIKPATVMPVFRNPLVVVGRDASGSDLKTILAGKKLALADPERDLAGSRGIEALGKAGITVNPLSDTVAVAESSIGVLRLLADATAEVGIVYATDVGRSPGLKVLLRLPAADYPTIDYAVAEAVNADNDTHPFLAYLQSDEAKAAFRAAGLEPIDK